MQDEATEERQQVLDDLTDYSEGGNHKGLYTLFLRAQAAGLRPGEIAAALGGQWTHQKVTAWTREAVVRGR